MKKLQIWISNTNNISFGFLQGAQGWMGIESRRATGQRHHRRWRGTSGTCPYIAIVITTISPDHIASFHFFVRGQTSIDGCTQFHRLGVRLKSRTRSKRVGCLTPDPRSIPVRASVPHVRSFENIQCIETQIGIPSRSPTIMPDKILTSHTRTFRWGHCWTACGAIRIQVGSGWTDAGKGTC